MSAEPELASAIANPPLPAAAERDTVHWSLTLPVSEDPLQVSPANFTEPEAEEAACPALERRLTPHPEIKNVQKQSKRINSLGLVPYERATRARKAGQISLARLNRIPSQSHYLLCN